MVALRYRRIPPVGFDSTSIKCELILFLISEKNGVDGIRNLGGFIWGGFQTIDSCFENELAV